MHPFIPIGTALFFFSGYIGEATIIGGLMHLTGCALFCTGVHKTFQK